MGVPHAEAYLGDVLLILAPCPGLEKCRKPSISACILHHRNTSELSCEVSDRVCPKWVLCPVPPSRLKFWAGISYTLFREDLFFLKIPP